MSEREESSSGLGVVILFVVAFLAVGGVLLPNFLPRRGHYGCDSAAVAALRTYLGAQNQFHRSDYYGLGNLVYANPKDGTGFSDPDGTSLKMIDKSFAEATLNGTARFGYLFCDILAGPEGPYDFSIDCGLCAFPEAYGESGRNTFIIDATGVIYQKDNEGRPVQEYPADPEADGWVPMDW